MKAKPWRTIAEKTLLDNERLSIQEDTVELPNGEQTTYIRHAPSLNDSVCMIVVNTKNEVLIQKEYSYPPNAVLWQLPGGSMNPSETIEQAALRELAEESGYGAKNTEVIGYYFTNNRLSDKRQHIVVCTDLYGHKLKEDPDEFIDSYWLTVPELKKHIASNEFNNINLLAALNVWFQHSN